MQAGTIYMEDLYEVFHGEPAGGPRTCSCGRTLEPPTKPRYNVSARALEVIETHHETKGAWPSSGDIWRDFGPTRLKLTRQQLESALTALITEGKISSFYEKKKTGRPAVRYKLAGV